MALSNGDLSTPAAQPIPGEAAVRFVAAPAQMRPCFAVPLVSLRAGANTLYLQDIDPADRIAGLSSVDPRAEELLPLPAEIGGVDYGRPAVHAILAPDGEALVGTREELRPLLAPWAAKIAWPVTRLAFADFMDDETAIISAADAALKRMAYSHGERAAAAWFGNAVVFRRLQRSALQAATTPARRAELERGLEQARIEVSGDRIIAHLPDVLMDVLDGANIKAIPALSMASRLAGLVSPSGLSLMRMATNSRVAPPAPRRDPGSPDRAPSGAQDGRTLRNTALKILSAKLNTELTKVRGSLYESPDGAIRVMISTSRRYYRPYQSYWYCFYEAQRQYLGQNSQSYLVLGALDSGRLWAIPAAEIDPLADEMTSTVRPNGQVYRHILSKLTGERCILRAGLREFDLTPFEL